MQAVARSESPPGPASAAIPADPAGSTDLPGRDAPSFETDPRFPSGPWTGFFLQPGTPERHWMELDLTFRDGIMAGAGRDRVGKFAVTGRYHLDDGKAAQVQVAESAATQDRDLLDVLEGALAIGRQADLLALEEVTTRLEAVHPSASTPTTASTTVAYSSKLAKIKAWFAPAA